MTHVVDAIFTPRRRHIPLAIVLAACLVGCPYIGPETHENNTENGNGDNDDDEPDDDQPDDDEPDPDDQDMDGDGFTAEEDCDDTNAARFPGNTELCDDVDNDCDDATPDAGLATLYPGNGNPPRNLDTTVDQVTVIEARTDDAEVRFCEGTFEMTFLFRNNPGSMLMSGLGQVVLTPYNHPVSAVPDRVVYAENSTVELNNITLADGSFADGGGAMLCIDSVITLNTVQFVDSTSQTGAALLASHCQLTGTQVQFRNNLSLQSNAAIMQASNGSTIDWTDASWGGNSGSQSLLVWDSTATLTRPILGDSTDIGIYLVGEGELTINNGDFSANEGDDLLLGTGTIVDLDSGENLNCLSPSGTCTRW